MVYKDICLDELEKQVIIKAREKGPHHFSQLSSFRQQKG